MTAAQWAAPPHLADIDEVLHELPDVELWVENYLSQAYFPAQQIGMFLHIGRLSFDQPAWDEMVLVYLPDDMFLAARGFCYGSETPQGPAGPSLTYQCIEPWRKWRKTFRGPARLVSGDELRSGGVTDGLHVKLSFELIYEASGPVFELGDMHEQNWASSHYEQHCAVTGTLSYGDVSVELAGTGLRDHSTGLRDLTGLHNHIWCHAEWPDGRAFCLMYLSNTDGTGRMNHAAVCTDGTVRYGRLVSAAPLLDSWDQRGDDYVLTLEVGDETIELTATIGQVGALALAGPGELVRGAARGEGCHHLLSEAMTKFDWDGQVGYGLTERSVLMR
jgi:hypothetical protein